MPYTALSHQPTAQWPEGFADVRGFEVRTRADDARVGKVADVLADSDGGPSYLDVDLGGFFSAKHVLLPAAELQVDAAQQTVWVSGLTKDEVKHLPAYDGDPSGVASSGVASSGVASSGVASSGVASSGVASSGVASSGVVPGGPSVPSATGVAAASAATSERAMVAAAPDEPAERAGDAHLTLSAEELALGRRAVQAGEVAVRKTVETERVRRTVAVMHEEVTIERRPAVGMDAATAQVEITEDEIRIPIFAEEVVVETRVVPKEAFIVRKRRVTETRTVEADLRRERLVEDPTTEPSAG